MYTWQNGRQLARMHNSEKNVRFKYNESGLRIQKVLNPDTANEEVTNYTLHGKNIVHMTKDKGNQHDSLHFFYDASNKPAIVEYNGTKYAYVHNLQGDIVAILDSSKKVVVSYVYDAWGRPIKKEGSLASTLGTVQPFRYRGYVYDEETGLYYLRSRYYHNTWERFLNCDALLGTIGALISSNLWTYCENDAINAIDNDGFESSLTQPFARYKIIGTMDGCGGGGGIVIGGVTWLSKIGSKIVHMANQVGIMLFPVAMYASEGVDIDGNGDTTPVRTGASPYNQEYLQALEATVQAIQLEALEVQSVTLPLTLKLRFKNDFHIHHIVPQGASGALVAQTILSSVYELGVNAPQNLVLLPARQHNSLHTAAYNHYVNQRVLHAYIGSTEGRRERVTNVLNTLRIELIGASLLFY